MKANSIKKPLIAIRKGSSASSFNKLFLPVCKLKSKVIEI
jgi:hypothetical protein